MSDFISRQAAVESIATALMQMDDPDAPRRTVEDYMPLAESMIRGVPAASVREVKRGRWIDRDGGLATCSECGDRWGVYGVMNFCPNCGADNREEEK